MRPSRTNFAVVIFSIGLLVAATLVVVLIRNPSTHANLEDPGVYDRTPLAYLDETYPYEGVGAFDARPDPDLAEDDAGRQLYVRAGCAGCHGVYAEGGAVGPSLWSDAAKGTDEVSNDLRNPPPGMPHYPAVELTDDEIGLILAHIAQLEADAGELGITPPPPPIATSTTEPTPAASEPEDQEPGRPAGPIETRSIEAPAATITVDGDIADWADVEGIEMTLEPIIEHDADPRAASVKVAHDDEFIYVLFTVDDDYNWSDIDPHFAGAPAVMWPVEEAAGPHMGGEELSGHPALGMVDVWYWRLDCPIGVEQGGAVSGPGDGDPGNDAACNFDDEWATDPETHDDDVGPGAENSLLGVFSHTDPVEDAEGTWYFEMRRPLQTGDPQDAQFTIGETTRLALAYWDPDAGQNGWGRRDHVQSSNQGWIEVTLTT